MTEPTGADPVGTVEIAERLGVSRSAVDAWRTRNTGFPEPRWTVGGRPAWEWEAVRQWAEANGRGNRITRGAAS